MNQPSTPDAYAKAGVNVSLGDMFSSFCGKLNRSTWNNSPFVEIFDFSNGHFRGPRGYEKKNLPSGTIWTAGADGLGTKPIVISAANLHRGAGANLLAMLAGDITRYGGFPLILINNLDLGTLGDTKDHPAFIAATELMRGLCAFAHEQDYVLLTGETAELPDCVTSEDPNSVLKFLWSGVMIGAMHPDKLINGSNIKPGDRVIALRDVTRSNGISLLRRYLRHRYCAQWYLDPLASDDIHEVAYQSAMYDKFLVYMNGWTTEGFVPLVAAHGIANLSGGGIKSKFGEDVLFPTGHSAKLDELWEPVTVMRRCAMDLEISDFRCYGYWGCGQGTLSVVSDSDSNSFIEYAEKFGIDAHDAGCICATEAGCVPSLEILSGFTGKKFTYYAGED